MGISLHHLCLVVDISGCQSAMEASPPTVVFITHCLHSSLQGCGGGGGHGTLCLRVSL